MRECVYKLFGPDLEGCIYSFRGYEMNQNESFLNKLGKGIIFLLFKLRNEIYKKGRGGGRIKKYTPLNLYNLIYSTISPPLSTFTN